MREIKLWDKGYVKTVEDKLGITDYSELVKDKEQIIRTVTSIAAISRGKDFSKNPELRFKHLLKEAAGDMDVESIYITERAIDKSYMIEKDYEDLMEELNVPGRPFEFIPVILKAKIEIDDNIAYVNYYTTNVDVYNNNTESLFRLPIEHSYIWDYSHKSIISEDGMIITNAYNVFTNGRALLRDLMYVKSVIRNYDAGVYLRIKIEDILFSLADMNDEYKNFFIVEVKAPYFAFAQIRTHGRLSQISISMRYASEDDYWLPGDITERWKENIGLIEDFLENKFNTLEFSTYLTKIKESNYDRNLILEFMLNKFSPIVGSEFLKLLGYKKEIYNRWSNHLKYNTWIIGGWLNDPKAWGHLLLERNATSILSRPGVQKETAEVVKAIKELIYERIEK